MRFDRGLIAGFFAAALAFAGAATAAVPHFGLKIVKTFPHDTGAFTEGLYYAKGDLYESTGLNGHSNIRQVKLDTGKVVRQLTISSKYFGEGIAPWNGRIISLTWRSGTGFVWNGAKFSLDHTFSYAGEGWGLTQNGRNLIMSDGTPTIKFLDPVSLKVVRTLDVTLEGQPIDQINELEWIKGEIYANIWRSPVIVRIDPATGKVDAVIDLSGLPEVQSPKQDTPDAVANGIAYDAAADRLFVTGKLWPHLYQVELAPQ